VRQHPPEAPRRRSRDFALQILYAVDVGTREAAFSNDIVEAQIERVGVHFEVSSGARAFGETLVRGVAQHKKELDRFIEAHALNWRMERMNVIDRNVLRLATFELLYTDTPAPIVIDEAIELARRFGIDPSPSFVNGILDALAHDLPGSSP